MREIRFRAWDGEDILTWESLTAPDAIGRSVMALWELNNEWEWMQFTGLQDKNGKDIYEGDICEFDSHDLIDIPFFEWARYY